MRSAAATGRITLHLQQPPLMRTHYTALLVLVLPPMSLLAQPTLNLGNMTPMEGSSVTYNYGPYVEPGSAGANQTWDFSALSYTEQHSVLFVPVSSTPNGSAFPGATVCQQYDPPNTLYGYTQFSSGAVDALGTDFPGFSTVHFTDPRRSLEFPFTFNDTWTDTFAGDGTSFGGITSIITGTVDGNADAYGTLVLPYGTFTNVLRVHTHSVTTTVTTPGGTSVVTEDVHLFFKPGTAMELLNIAQADNSSSALFLTENSIGVEEALTQDIGVDVMPNPATDAISVTYGAAGAVKLAVYDALGRAVMESDFGRVPPGIHREQLDVSALSDGQYLLRITTADGQTGHRTFVVE